MKTFILSLVLSVLTLGVMGVFGSARQVEQRDMIEDIDSGSVLAWARHITGQDPNDMNDWDDFESVAVIPGRSQRANGDTRLDDEVWTVVKRDVNGVTVRYIEQFQPLDWGDDPNYCWFVDGAGQYTMTSGTPEVPEVPATYTYTWIIEDSILWGVPVTDRTLLCLDAGGSARNAGGGIVALPYAGNPFVAGETVYIYGTTFYNDTHTLTAGTSASELQFSAAYNAETFDGTETVFRRMSVTPGNGSMVSDSAGNLYYAHDWSVAKGSGVTKIDSDGVEDYSFLTWPTGATNLGTVNAIAISSDEGSLYVFTQKVGGYAIKFDLTTGVADWTTAVLPSVGYDMTIDDDGNAYAITGNDVHRYAVADGADTQMIEGSRAGISGGPSYSVEVDDDVGILLAGGYTLCLDSESEAVKGRLYNLAICTLDGVTSGYFLIGTIYDAGGLTWTPVISKGCVVPYGGYIYVLLYSAAPASTIYKYQWNGSTLTEITNVAGPSYGIGMYFDLWGNLVVVNQDISTPQYDVLYYYDADLNYLSKCENMYSILRTWDSLVGGTYIQGNAIPNGDLGTPGTPAVPGTMYVATDLGGEHVCVYADAIPRGAVDPNTGRRATYLMDGNDILDFNEADYTVVIAGLNYFSILETLPLGNSRTTKRPSAIKNVQVNFQDSMGAHVGVDLSHASDWLFSEDDFNTPMAPFTGYKGPAPFLWGVGRQPAVYLWEQCPIPMTIRSITANMEITFE